MPAQLFNAAINSQSRLSPSGCGVLQSRFLVRFDR